MKTRHLARWAGACTWGAVLAALAGSAAADATPPKGMVPLEQYLMASDAEIALARSAAPAAISEKATVLTLDSQGYQTAVRGTNGFTCLVERSWMAPFENMGMTTLTIRNTGGTDHQSFDAVGLPGFQFIQDTIEYNSRTHHSNMDVYDRIQAADMMQNAVIVASFVYHAANRDQLLPRKPMPKPAPAGRGTGPAQ